MSSVKYIRVRQVELEGVGSTSPSPTSFQVSGRVSECSSLAPLLRLVAALDACHHPTGGDALKLNQHLESSAPGPFTPERAVRMNIELEDRNANSLWGFSNYFLRTAMDSRIKSSIYPMKYYFFPVFQLFVMHFPKRKLQASYTSRWASLHMLMH